jgi:hypothetical protein
VPEVGYNPFAGEDCAFDARSEKTLQYIVGANPVMTSMIQISGVCERDIDLLLLEEFVASESFCQWFLSKIGIGDVVRLTAAQHSVTTINGESDLELTFQRPNGILKLLIEDKVDAIFQPRQPERYRERAGGYINAGHCSDVLTVVIAPETYFEGQEADEFDYRMTYESLLEWFGQAENLGNRTIYKAGLLQGAIERGRTGWKLVPDTTVTEFWRHYWELAGRVAPDLRMTEPKEKPTTSYFIQFRPLVLSRGVTLWHKLPHGNVDLQFAAMGAILPEMERLYGKHLIPPMQIERTAKSAVVRLKVPEVDMFQAFADSETAVRKALDAALALTNWYRHIHTVPPAGKNTLA